MDILRVHSARARPRSGRHLCAPERRRVTQTPPEGHWRLSHPSRDGRSVGVQCAERYTLWIAMSAPATPATLRMWPAFEVTTAWFRRTAPSTTETSTMSS